MDVSKWIISDNNNNNKYVQQYIFVFNGPLVHLYINMIVIMIIKIKK